MTWIKNVSIALWVTNNLPSDNFYATDEAFLDSRYSISTDMPSIPDTYNVISPTGQDPPDQVPRVDLSSFPSYSISDYEIPDSSEIVLDTEGATPILTTQSWLNRYLSCLSSTIGSLELPKRK